MMKNTFSKRTTGRQKIINRKAERFNRRDKISTEGVPVSTGARTYRPKGPQYQPERRYIDRRVHSINRSADISTEESTVSTGATRVSTSKKNIGVDPLNVNRSQIQKHFQLRENAYSSSMPDSFTPCTTLLYKTGIIAQQWVRAQAPYPLQIST